MANTESYNVIYVDTTNYTRSTVSYIKEIKYIGASNGTLLITAGTSGSGARLFEASGTGNIIGDVEINAMQGFHVAVTNGAKAYIYLK